MSDDKPSIDAAIEICVDEALAWARQYDTADAEKVYQALLGLNLAQAMHLRAACTVIISELNSLL